MDTESDLREYRANAWNMATIIPGMSVQYGSYGDFPDFNVTYRMNATHTFIVEHTALGKLKVTKRGSRSKSDSRRVKTENLIGTIVKWATDEDAYAKRLEAEAQEREARNQARLSAMRTLYGEELKLADQLTGNKRRQSWQRHNLNPAPARDGYKDGEFVFSIDDDGEVDIRFRVNALPLDAEGKARIEPTVKLIRAIGFAIAEAYTAYHTRNAAAAAVEAETKPAGKVVPLHA